MRNILQYFDLIAGILDHSGVESAEVEFDATDRANGIVDGVLWFHDGSRLEFTEVVSIRNRCPVKQLYRYQYVHTEKIAFRYDNAAHHPDLLNFPHHKHVGRKKLPATEPALNQVLEEIAVLQTGTAPVPTAPAKRRSRSKARVTQ